MSRDRPTRSARLLPLLLPGLLVFAAGADQAPTTGPGADDVLLQALVEELTRSMDLQLEDLERPYLIQYQVEERATCWLTASYGALTTCQRDARRSFASRVRVGDYDLDNTNFAGAYRGGGATLPLDDDRIAIRQAIWRATDRDYKRAVETLTRKKAYLEHKNVQDRPPDYTRVDPVVHLEPRVDLVFDQDLWAEKVKRLSARFKCFTKIQKSDVRLAIGALNCYIVDSEGTRLRIGDTGVVLTFSAELQADDGMRLSDTYTCGGFSLEDLPSLEHLEADVDELCRSLIEAAAAPILEEYTGPVLFDEQAAGQVFASLLAPGLAGRPDPIGSQRSYSETALDKRLGKRILPKTFQVYDDPIVKRYQDRPLFGWYEYDDEGVPARRVDLVKDGILKTQVTARAPTKKIPATTGHGRVGRFGSDARAAVANLFLSSNDGRTDEELTEALIEACRDEALDFGLRVVALQGVIPGGLADPVFVYKVYVDDPHRKKQERVRGLEFKPVQVRSLRSILAAGRKQYVHNYLAGSGTTVVAPAVLFEELELTRIEEEFDKLPILESPVDRQTPGAPSAGADGVN